MCNTYDGEIQAARLYYEINKVQKYWKLIKINLNLETYFRFAF